MSQEHINKIIEEHEASKSSKLESVLLMLIDMLREQRKTLNAIIANQVELDKKLRDVCSDAWKYKDLCK